MALSGLLKDETPVLSGVLSNSTESLSGTLSNRSSTLTGILGNSKNDLSGTLEKKSNDLSGTLNPKSSILTGTLSNRFNTLSGILSNELIRGFSAYELAVKNGLFEGTEKEWLESLRNNYISVNVLEDTTDSYILQFIINDINIITPNLRNNVNVITNNDIKNILLGVENHNHGLLDDIGLEYLLQYLATVEQVNNIKKVGNTEYWNEHSDYIPKYGEIIIIKDDEHGDTIAIGDGINTVFNLNNISSTVQKLHTLTIGEHVYDGSKDVVVGVYNGEINDEELENLARMVDVIQQIDTMQLLTSNVDTMTMLEENNMKQMMQVNSNTDTMQLLINEETNPWEMKLRNNGNTMKMATNETLIMDTN